MTIIRWTVTCNANGQSWNFATSSEGNEKTVWAKFMHLYKHSPLKPSKADFTISLCETAMAR